jgi:hypothetical protein
MIKLQRELKSKNSGLGLTGGLELLVLVYQDSQWEKRSK